MTTKIKINTESIVNAVSEKKTLPYFLNSENELTFKENMKELYSFLAQEHPKVLEYGGKIISEESWNESKFYGSLFTSIFSHWSKLLYQKSIFFVEIIEDFPKELELEIEGETFIVFYLPTSELLSKRDECIYETEEDSIFDFFDWLEGEIISVDGIPNLFNKYKSFTEVFVENTTESTDDDGDTTIELSDSFYEDIEELKKSVLLALEDNLNLDSNNMLSIDKVNKEKKISPTVIELDWNGIPIEMKYPFDLTKSLIEKEFPLEILDNQNGWLAQQSAEVQETITGLWADFIYNKHKDTQSIRDSSSENGKLKVTWDDFSEYLLYWLRFDYAQDIKKIDKKIRSTYEKITSQNKISDFNYIDNASEFIKCILYVEKQSAITTNKGIILDVENIQKQYFYALNNEHVLGEIWSIIVQDRIKKAKVTRTFEYQFESLKDKFPNFHEVIDYYSGAMYIFEQTGTPPAPVLLLGSPGLGKTHFASEIAKIIGSLMTVIPISSLSAGWIISGAASQWKDAQMGKLAQALINGNSMSPVIVLDEIDKKSEGNYDPLGSLYPLLEYQTAKEFVDEYLEFPINASSVLWVATANNLNSISEPILDRFVVFDIAKLNHADTIKVANNIFNELTHGLNHTDLSEDILDMLKDKTPRQIKQILKKALAYAAVKRSQEIILKKEHLDLKAKIKKIGF